MCDFDEKQEAEADWFMGALLLPRNVLTYFVYNKTPFAQVKEENMVSDQPNRSCMQMTGGENSISVKLVQQLIS